MVDKTNKELLIAMGFTPVDAPEGETKVTFLGPKGAAAMKGMASAKGAEKLEDAEKPEAKPGPDES